MSIDWTHGYTSSWRVSRIEPSTWEPCGELRGIESVSIERDGTDKAPMLETATVTASMAATEPFEAGWHRIYMDAVQGTYSESVPVATLWLESESSAYAMGARKDSIKGKSVLWQASAEPIGDGVYAPAGIDGADWAVRMLSACIDAPVDAEGGFELDAAHVFDLNATVLDAVWALLTANGWCMGVDGRGAVHVRPMPSEPALVLDRDGARIMMPSVTYRRGKLTYKREYSPGVVPFSVVRGALPEWGLDGDYRVKTQRLTCGRGILVEESVEAI